MNKTSKTSQAFRLLRSALVGLVGKGMRGESGGIGRTLNMRKAHLRLLKRLLHKPLPQPPKGKEKKEAGRSLFVEEVPWFPRSTSRRSPPPPRLSLMVVGRPLGLLLVILKSSRRLTLTVVGERPRVLKCSSREGSRQLSWRFVKLSAGATIHDCAT